MSTFQVWLLIGLGIAAVSLFYAAVELGRANRHLSNIADRLLDIDRTMRGRPE